MTLQTTSLNLRSTSLPGITGATTPSTFTSSPTGTAGQRTLVGAILTEPDTTVTAIQVTSTTGLLLVDGTTLTWRQGGITLSDGVVISAGFNGLVDRTTTALFSPIVYTPSSSSSGIVTIETINPSSSVTVLQGTRTTRSTGTTNGPTTSRGGTAASASASTSSTSSAGTAPTLSAGKAAALLGLVGGFVAMAL